MAALTYESTSRFGLTSGRVHRVVDDDTLKTRHT